ncbi:hypothetical protein SAY87_001729 [Trapa incisa]|uniref:Uncharacterized protein n=1 Tax=Trapa incisa TaxID=236973 RepID=A0AAN7JVS0_9MYRT|nr:hypothetical protein SAY87_001729 [Trapa incisa]
MDNCVSPFNGHSSALEYDFSIGTEAADHRPSVVVNRQVQGSTDGNEGEMFFESQLCLESDCEDYFSVRDDTPSLGNSPIHHQKNLDQPSLEESPSKEAVPVKQLRELFEESFRAGTEDEPGFVSDLPAEKPDSPSASPLSPVMASDQAPSPLTKAKSKSTTKCQCCVASLVRRFMMGQNKKKAEP